jgi:hypothetical protein
VDPGGARPVISGRRHLAEQVDSRSRKTSKCLMAPKEMIEHLRYYLMPQPMEEYYIGLRDIYNHVYH